MAHLHCSFSCCHSEGAEVEASVEWRTYLRNWVALSGHSSNLLKQLTCVESAQCLSHSAESWQGSVHGAAMPDVWVNLQGRYGIRSKYRIAPRKQQYIKILKFGENSRGLENFPVPEILRSLWGPRSHFLKSLAGALMIPQPALCLC